MADNERQHAENVAMAIYETGFCQSCSKVRNDTDNERGLCRSCVWYHYPDTDEGRRCKAELDAEVEERTHGD